MNGKIQRTHTRKESAKELNTQFGDCSSRRMEDERRCTGGAIRVLFGRGKLLNQIELRTKESKEKGTT